MATPLEFILEKIRSAPQGPTTCAFFDFDGTIISGYSVEVFVRRRLLDGDVSIQEIFETVSAALKGIRETSEIQAFMDASIASFRGRSVAEMSAGAEKIFRDEIASRLHTEVWQVIQTHQAMGHRVVIASSATQFQVEPMAAEIGADHVLCTRLEQDDGVLTGKIDGVPLWGPNKARAVRDYAAETGTDLHQAFAYGNGDEDLLYLETVGNPVAVEPDAGLAREADQRRWPILRCERRGRMPSLTSLARTAAFYGGMAAAGGTGLGLGLLNGSYRSAIDLSISLASELGLSLAGVDVEITQGAEHLVSSRPCVFVFNHQSKLDTIILGKLLRGGITGVAKKEAASVPGFGQFFQLAGVAFVDRGNTSQAKEALRPAVEKIRKEKLSLVMAPEGTRSTTPKLGPFKKGAFHIAMQAGVPMVPIVIRNAGEMMWRNDQTVRTGKVEVVVLEPIDTSGWTLETINTHVADVRGQFLATLENWPEPKTRRAARA